MQGGSNKINIFAGSNDVAGIPTANFRVNGSTGKVTVKGSIEADGNSYSDSSGDQYAIMSHNGLYVSGGSVFVKTSSETGNTNNSIELVSDDEYGGEASVEISNGSVEISINSAFDNPDCSLSIGATGVQIGRGSIGIMSYEDVVSSDDVKHLVIVNTGGSAGSQNDTLYFIKS
jgi:hypothetical protein